jgi:hypothetical protein
VITLSVTILLSPMASSEHSAALPGGQLSPEDPSKASSYITPELAEHALLRRVDSVEGARVVGRRDKLSNYAGMLFPYVRPGEHMPREYRLRRDLDGVTSTDPTLLSARREKMLTGGMGNWEGL